MQKLSQNNIPSKNILTALTRTEKNVKSITKYLKWRDNAQKDKICQELMRKQEKNSPKSIKKNFKEKSREMR
jgi:hypothetical protein